jgi:hypothetical protein
VLDDIIVWWVGDDRFDVMPNASNTERVRAAIGGIDVTATRAVIAVQGPAARERLGALAPEAAAVARRRVATATVAGVSCVVAGTGYTGEDGVSWYPGRPCGRVWDAVVAAGVTPAAQPRRRAWRRRPRPRREFKRPSGGGGGGRANHRSGPSHPAAERPRRAPPAARVGSRPAPPRAVPDPSTAPSPAS